MKVKQLNMVLSVYSESLMLYLYGLEQFAAVIASMPGYKSKSTTIWMDEKAISLDFILEPDITTGENTLGSICDCYDGKSKLLMVEYLAGFHFEVYFILVLILAFLCLILMRRMKHNIVKLRHSPKRSAAI